MPIVNFTITPILEQKVNQTVKKLGFTSKAELFRFAVMDFIKNLDRDLTDEEFSVIVGGLTDSIAKKLRGKKFPPLEEQMADLLKD